jgi:RNA polymerase sigma factor (sigma-70 family)
MNYSQLNKEYMAKYKAGDESYLWKLVELNEKLCYRFAHKYSWIDVEFEDLVAMIRLYLIRAVRRFDISKGFAFMTFAYSVINNQLRHYNRDAKRRGINTLSITTEISENDTLEDVLEADVLNPCDTYVVRENALRIRKALNSFEEVDRDILIELVVNKKPQREVAEKHGISQVQVSRKQRILLAKLKIKFEKTKGDVA